jgi:hypothetical protein
MTYPSMAVRKPYSRSASLAAINAAHTVVPGDCASMTFGVFSVNATVGAQLVAEGRLSDASPWLALHLMPTNDLTPGSPIAQTPVITTLPTNGWRVDTQGMAEVRVRLSALTTGSLVVETRLSQQPYA